MNENIDLAKILKNCPKGTKLYSTIFGDVEFCYIDESDAYPIKLNVDSLIPLSKTFTHLSVVEAMHLTPIACNRFTIVYVKVISPIM